MLLIILVFCGASAAATTKNNPNIHKANQVGMIDHLQDKPVVSGNIIVWQQEDTNRHDAIFYKNLATGTYGKVFPSIKDQKNPAISGTRVVWEQDTPKGTAIYAKNLQTGALGRVQISSKNQYNPSIDGNIIVWSQDTTSYYIPIWGKFWKHNIYYKNIITGTCRKVMASTADQTSPDVSGSRVIWLQDKKLYFKNLKTGTVARVFKTPNEQDNAAIYGTRVVWEQTELNAAYPVIYIKNLATGAMGRLQKTGNYQFDPDISGSRVVWYDWKDVNNKLQAILMVKNLVTGKYGAVFPSKLDQTYPCISGTRIVWVQDDYPPGSYISWSVYTMNLKTGKAGRVHATP